MATVNPISSFRIIFFVRAATAAVLPPCVYTGGSRQILRATANGDLPPIDGVTLAVGQYVLVKDQVAGVVNGAYLVQSIGGIGTRWQMVRASPFLGGKALGGAAFRVSEGTTNAETLWFCTNEIPTDVIGTDPLTFSDSGSTPIPLDVVRYNTVPGAVPALIDATGFAGDVTNADAALASLLLYLAHRASVPGVPGIGVQILLQADDGANALANAGEILATLVDTTAGATLGKLRMLAGHGRGLAVVDDTPAASHIEVDGPIRATAAAPVALVRVDAVNNAVTIVSTLTHLPNPGPGANNIGVGQRFQTLNGASTPTTVHEVDAQLVDVTPGAELASVQLKAGAVTALQLDNPTPATVTVLVGGLVSALPGIPLALQSPAGQALQLGANGGGQWIVDAPSGNLVALANQLILAKNVRLTGIRDLGPGNYNVTPVDAFLLCTADNAIDVINLTLPNATTCEGFGVSIRRCWGAGAAPTGAVNLLFFAGQGLLSNTAPATYDSPVNGIVTMPGNTLYVVAHNGNWFVP